MWSHFVGLSRVEENKYLSRNSVISFTASSKHDLREQRAPAGVRWALDCVDHGGQPHKALLYITTATPMFSITECKHNADKPTPRIPGRTCHTSYKAMFIITVTTDSRLEVTNTCAMMQATQCSSHAQNVQVRNP